MKTWLRLGTPWEEDADSRLSEEHEPAGDDDLQARPSERGFFMTWGLRRPADTWRFRVLTVILPKV